MSTDNELTEEEIRNLRASPWAIEAGLLVEKDGEIFVTPKGLAVMREQMEKQGVIPRRN